MKISEYFSYLSEDKNNKKVQDRRSKAFTNICAIISILLFIYLIKGL
ncbi:hypothetical protein [Clostridium sp.]|nr:hypothetical protein [Clostridium sp.]